MYDSTDPLRYGRSAGRMAATMGHLSYWLGEAEAALLAGDASLAAASVELAHRAADHLAADLDPLTEAGGLRPRGERADEEIALPPGIEEAVRRHLLTCPSGARDADGHRCDCGRSAALACRGCGQLLAVAHEPGARPCRHYDDAAAWLTEEER